MFCSATPLRTPFYSTSEARASFYRGDALQALGQGRLRRLPGQLVARWRGLCAALVQFLRAPPKRMSTKLSLTRPRARDDAQGNRSRLRRPTVSACPTACDALKLNGDWPPRGQAFARGVRPRGRRPPRGYGDRCALQGHGRAFQHPCTMQVQRGALFSNAGRSKQSFR